MNRTFQTSFLSVVLLSGMLAAACAANFNPESRLIDVGGHRLNIRCSGEGAPAVMLISGLASDNHDWLTVEEKVSESTRVCSYDRAGLGESDPVDRAPTAQTAADRLHALLSAAGVNGPVVLVGHSYGGFIAQIYGAQHPENTAAVVLVDSLQKDNLVRTREILGDQLMAAFTRATQANPEGVDLVTSYQQVETVETLGDLPLTVITAGVPNLPPLIEAEVRERLTGSWSESQQDLVRLSTAGTHIIAQQSGHCVQCDQPDLVADVILELAGK